MIYDKSYRISKINNFVDIPFHISLYIILIWNRQLNFFLSTSNQTPYYRTKPWVEINDNTKIGSYDVLGKLNLNLQC